MDATPAPLRDPLACYAKELAHEAASGRKSERTQARIRAATCRLLDAAPAAELKVTDICREAGVAHGTFYVYFRDIRHLLTATLTGFVGFLQAAMRHAARGAGTDSVRSTTAAYVTLFEQNAGLMRCLVSRIDDASEAARAFEKLNRDWAETVVDARLRQLAQEGRSGALTPDELLRRAYALGAMVDQYLIMLLFGRDDALIAVSRDRDAVVATLSLIWERGMEP